MSDKKNEKIEAERHRSEKIEESGQATLDRNDKNRTIHLISIIGEVEGHDNLGSNSKTTKYEHILPQLAAIEDSSESDDTNAGGAERFFLLFHAASAAGGERRPYGKVLKL